MKLVTAKVIMPGELILGEHRRLSATCEVVLKILTGIGGLPSAMSRG